MSPVEIQRANTPLVIGPLQWARMEFGVDASCGNGHVSTLTRATPRPEDHKIDKNGNVTPSLDCPHKGCEWHEFIRLTGWSG